MKKILKQKINSPLLASVLTSPLAIISWVIFKLAAIKIGKSSLSVSQVSSFPEDIEKLWECVSAHYDVILEWRYVLALNRYLTLIARSKEGKSQAIL